MSGFRAFLLRGNLVELAVAFIMGAAFGDVVKTFVALLTSLFPASSVLHFDENTPSGAFYNSLVSFVSSRRSSTSWWSSPTPASRTGSSRCRSRHRRATLPRSRCSRRSGTRWRKD